MGSVDWIFVVVGTVPISTSFGHISTYVVQAQTVSLKTTRRVSGFPRVFTRYSWFGDSIIVIIATCGSTSVRILPLGFGGQPLAIPVGIGFCLSSTDENHGVIVKGGIFFNFGLAFEVVSALLHKFSELTHGGLVLIYVEGVQLHLMHWRRMIHPFLASILASLIW